MQTMLILSMAMSLSPQMAGQLEPAGDPPPAAGFVAASEAGALDAAYLAHGLASATIMRGPGLTARTDFQGYYDSATWSTAPAFPGVDDPHYLSVILETDTWYEIIFDSIDLAYQDAGSGESARRLELRWSVDGFASPLFTDLSVASWPEVDFNSISLPLLPPQTGVIEFRLFGYGAPSRIGVLGLANTPLLALADEDAALIIRGELQIIPEPPTLAAILGLVLVCLLLLRNLRRGDGSPGDRRFFGRF